MKRTYHFLLPVLSLFLVRVDLTDLVPLRMSVKSVKVLDGDTMMVGIGRNQFKVRLMYIDAPERGQTGNSIDFGDYSTDCLKKIIKEPKTLMVYGYDRYGRILGEVDDLSIRMVLEGCAYLYEYAKFSSRAERTKFLIAQNKAQKLQKGLWKFKVLNPHLYRKMKFKPLVKNTLTD